MDHPPEGADLLALTHGAQGNKIVKCTGLVGAFRIPDAEIPEIE
jgi:hypothetical protein